MADVNERESANSEVEFSGLRSHSVAVGSLPVASSLRLAQGAAGDLFGNETSEA